MFSFCVGRAKWLRAFLLVSNAKVRSLLGLTKKMLEKTTNFLQYVIRVLSALCKIIAPPRCRQHFSFRRKVEKNGTALDFAARDVLDGEVGNLAGLQRLRFGIDHGLFVRRARDIDDLARVFLAVNDEAYLLARHDGFLLKHYAKQSYAETHARPVAQGKDGQAVVGVGKVVEGELGNVYSWHRNEGLMVGEKSSGARYPWPQ